MDQASQPSVLLVGELGFLLENELSMQGFACASAETAGDAVNRLKNARFPVVVVPPRLQDMGGVEFIQGVLRFFDSNVVLLGDADQTEVEALVRTGRVAHLPEGADGRPLVEILARAVPRAPTPTGQKFNLTPSGAPVPASGSPLFSTPSQTPSARAGAFPSSSNGPPGFGPSPSFPPAPSGASPFGGAFPSSGFPASGGSPSGFPSSGFPSSGFPSPGLPTAVGTFAQGGSFPPSASTFPPGFGASASPRPPTLGPTPGVAGGAGAGVGMDTASLLVEKQQAQQKLEALADELARAKAELSAAQARASQTEQERAALMSEVEAARRSAIANVAEVMALSDEGDPISEELDVLRGKIAAAEKERDAARDEASGLRAERDRLLADTATSAASLTELRTRAEGAEAKLTQAQTDSASEVAALKELASGLSAEVEQVRAELEQVRAERDAKAKELEGASGAASTTSQELESARAELTKLETRNTEIEHLLNEAVAARRALEAELEQARAANTAMRDVEGALRTELDKTRVDVASARTDATTSRLDLQEAMMRLDEAQTALEQLKKDSETLRAEADPLRTWAQQVAALHATQQQQIEELRKELQGASSGAGRVGELEAQVAKLSADLEAAKKGGGGGSLAEDAEVLLSRARHLASLVQALEPFMWGLTQATHFYTKAKVEGAEDHLKLLQQLQGVLLRLRDEIAMLDLG